MTSTQRNTKTRAVRRTRARATQSSRAQLELQILQAFRLIVASARAHDAEVRRIAGIPGSQVWALSEIALAAGISVGGLAERMALHQTTASNLVNALVERRLVQRRRDTNDQRMARLFVTTEGKRMLLKAPGPYTGLLVDGLRHLRQEQLTALRKNLRILIGVLRNPSRSAAGETLLDD